MNKKVLKLPGTMTTTIHVCTITHRGTHAHNLDLEKTNLEIINGEHELREARQLEEKEMTGLQQLAGVTQCIVW